MARWRCGGCRSAEGGPALTLWQRGDPGDHSSAIRQGRKLIPRHLLIELSSQDSDSLSAN